MLRFWVAVASLVAGVLLAAPASAQIIEAIENRDLAAVQAAIEAGDDVNGLYGTNKNVLPLGLAALTENAEIARALIAAGARYDAAEIEGRVAFLSAIQSGAFEVMSVLLESGASPGDEQVTQAVEQARPAMVAVFQHHMATGASGPFALDSLGFNPDMTVELVKAVQIRLVTLGYYRGAFDGVLDGETLEALRAFNTQAGIEPVDAVTSSTLAELNRATHPDCGSEPMVLKTNVFWQFRELVRHGCLTPDAGLNEIQSITETRAGVVSSYSINCESESQLVMAPDTTILVGPWYGLDGVFEMGSLRIEGCLSYGEQLYIIGAGSKVTFTALSP